MRSLCVFAFVLAVVTSGAAAAPQEYEIKLVRPLKAGQKYTLAADGAVNRTNTIKLGGKAAGVNEDGFGVRLEGRVEILEINGDGEEGKVACTISKCTRITPAGETELVPPGRVITATGGKEDTTFTIDHGELSGEAKEALDLVLRMGENDGYNDDRIYGTSKRQPIGGSWNLDAQASADEAKADGVMFDPKDITGSLKLERIEKVDGIDCMRIAGETEIKNFTATAPAGMTFERGSLKARYAGLYPLDMNLGTLAESMSITNTATLRGKNAAGQAAVIETKVQRATEMKRTFLVK